MANKVVIDIETRFTDNATQGAKNTARAFDEIEKEAAQAGKKIDEIGKKKVKPTIDVDSTKSDRKIDQTESKLKKLRNSKTQVVLDALDRASEKLEKVLNKAKSFSGKTYSAMVKIRDSDALSTLNKISNGAKNIAGKTWSAAVKIKDLATAPLRGIKNMLFSIKSLVLAITAGMAAKQFIVNPISLADQYSSAQIGFSTLLGDSAGQQMMNDLDAFAKATPFKSADVIAQTQRMLAMGWNVDNIISDMQTIGDAAAATGKGEQGLQQIVTALAQIKTKGKLSTEELNQLAEAGISAKRYLAEGLGYGSGDKGIAAMTEDLEDGVIGADKALQALLSGMKEYQGMMDKTANETVGGLWSQIQDTFEINIFRRWGQGLQDGAKDAFGSVVTLLNEADGALTEFGDTIYDVGKNISNWFADKFENAVERITEITDSFEFKEASLGEKISMLWKNVVADPFKKWFTELWTDEENITKATEFGRTFAENLTKGILGVLGLTDVFGESGLDAEKGSNIAQGFAQGFVDGFDVSAITGKLVDAIGNVWGALPWWAKILIGGYGIGTAAGGIANFAGGVANFMGGASSLVGNYAAGTGLIGMIGSTGNAMVSGTGILGNLAGAGYALTGGAAASGLSGGMAALAGGAGIAGGIAAGASVFKGGYDLYNSYKAYKAGDTTEAKASAASGGTTLGGVAAGAAIGSIFGPLGTLVGAGIGGVAGWFGGSKWADSIREVDDAVNDVTAATQDLQTEEEKLAEQNKRVWQNMKDHFGDIKLSMSEIERLANQIVWGDDIEHFEQLNSAVKQAEASLQSLKTAAENTNRWMWKASLGVKFNDDEIESIKASFDDYINAAKSYVENKHYEFTAAVSLLVDVESEEGKSIVDSGNAFYGKLQEQLEELGGKLSKTVEIALEDGVITLDEQAEITNLQKQIAAITEKISNAEQEAELALIKVKFGSGKLDLDSFDAFMAQMETTLSERMAANDTAFTASVATLNLELKEGAITQEEYDRQLQTLIDGYTGKVESIRAQVLNVELEIIGEAYADEGVTAEKLKTALEKSLASGIDPIDWTVDQAREFLGIDSLSESSALAIAQMLGGVSSQLELVEVDGKLLLDLGIETKEDPVEKVKSSLPKTVNTTVGVNISGEKHIQDTIDILSKDFGIPDKHAATVALLLTGDKKLLNKIDISKLADEFGIEDSVAKKIVAKISGAKSIENRLSILASDFGIPDSISKTISLNVTAVAGKIKNTIGNNLKSIFGFNRGGIVGGSSALEAFARGGIAGYSDGGIVQGGAKLIKVAEEGDPEMIIPLGSQRRDRALKLWAKAGEMLGVNKFARGGRTDGRDEGIRFQSYGSEESAGGQSVQVNMGGVQVSIQVDASNSENITEAIKAQANEIAETVAGIMADALSSQFENTPVRGGA